MMRLPSNGVLRISERGGVGGRAMNAYVRENRRLAGEIVARESGFDVVTSAGTYLLSMNLDAKFKLDLRGNLQIKSQAKFGRKNGREARKRLCKDKFEAKFIKFRRESLQKSGCKFAKFIRGKSEFKKYFVKIYEPKRGFGYLVGANLDVVGLRFCTNESLQIARTIKRYTLAIN